jgi:hypothetical protein
MVPATQQAVDGDRRFRVCFETSGVRAGDTVDGIEFSAGRPMDIDQIRWRTRIRIPMP